MDYVKQLRLKVGHQPLILVGATILIFDKENKLLMQRRSDNGMWGIPGGHMDLGETIENTARRETLEETGIAVGKLKFINIYSGPELFYEYPNGDQVYMVSVVYMTREYKLEKDSHDAEVKEIKYFPLNDLPENISPPIIPIINDYKQNYVNNPYTC
jgi:8-oxo-dGTP pyrophosphatase MutT (NUDIX family)